MIERYFIKLFLTINAVNNPNVLMLKLHPIKNKIDKAVSRLNVAYPGVQIDDHRGIPDPAKADNCLK
jgi:hypothetical protein